MEMTWFMGIIDKTLLLATLYIAMFMYSARIEWKRPKFHWFFICVTAMLGFVALDQFVFTNILNGNPFTIIINNGADIVIVVGCVASMLFMKKYSRAKILFVGCASYATFYIANNFYSIFVSFATGPDGFLGGHGIDTIGMIVLFSAFCVIYAIVYIVCWFAFVKKQEGGIEYNVDKTVFLIFILIFVINIFFGDFENNTLKRVFIVNRILSCMLILFVLFVQSKYLNTRAENQRLQYIMEQQKKQYDIAKESIEQVNVKAHDIKHFVDIFRLNGTVPDKVISDLSNLGKEFENIYDTGNKALNITLSEKCKSFTENDIVFSVISDGTALSFMSDVDIYVLFGNLMENAKEAVLNIEDADNRIIGMYIKRIGQFISVHVENTFSTKPDFVDGIPQTSKSDKVNHGFGTKSIQLIVEKYHGRLKFDVDDKLFTVDIAFFGN